jgi:Rod binding domain-containing protein
MPIQTIHAPPLAQATPPANTVAKDSPAKLRKAATDFEALLLGQMLKSAREAGGTGLTGNSDDDEANSSLLELGEQQFAQAMASSGALGIAKMVLAGLTNHADR